MIGEQTKTLHYGLTSLVQTTLARKAIEYQQNRTNGLCNRMLV